jgi:DNA-binding FadR family transcriptional regulator
MQGEHAASYHLFMGEPGDAATHVMSNGRDMNGSLHGRVLDKLGLAVCGKEIPPGTVMRLEEIERQHSASRSVIREAVRVLESMGLVSSRRRVGVLVLPPSEWNLYDPQVIRWRLASAARPAQLRSLTELRIAIEPEAARLAAMRAPLTNASDLMGLSGKLWAAGEAGETEQFLLLDIQFHGLILASSGNEMFARLESVVGEVLAGRTNYGLMPKHPHQEALQHHMDVASAIQRGDPRKAHAAMLSIMERTLEEMSSIWDEPFKNSDYIRKNPDFARDI